MFIMCQTAVPCRRLQRVSQVRAWVLLRIAFLPGYSRPQAEQSLRQAILDPETSIATYVFNADGATVDTQYITSGDTLSEPAAPVKEGHRFIGWYVGETPVTFGTVSTVSETAEIIVEARFEEVYYVFFHNPEGAVVATKEGIAGDEITT